MQVLVNGHDVGTIEGQAQLGEVLEHVRRELIPEGMVLTGLALDGRELADLDPAATEVDADAATALVVRCGSPSAIVADSRDAMGAWMEKLERALTACADQARRGQDWNAGYVGCLDAFQTFVRYAHPAAGVLESEGHGAAPSLASVSDDLRELERAFVRRDDVGVADVLEYQLAALVHDWREYLR